MKPKLALLLVTAIACGNSGSVTTADGPDATTPGKDSGGGAEQDSGGGGGEDSTTTQVVRFVSVGDTGKGNTEQKEVADAMEAKCKKDGCDFAVLLGDNLYDSGASSTTDGIWQSNFEVPYKNIDLDFFAVLGNHDYGGNGGGWEPAKAQVQVDYTAKSQKWKMPAKHYKVSKGHIDLIGLDTNEQMFGNDDQQKVNVKGWIEASTATWKLALGHHPYLSNGPHGNAGRYDGIPGVPIVSGGNVKTFMETQVCGKVDLYLCGHDHSRQWLTDKCGGTTELMVNGAGASVTDLKGSNATHFQAKTLGFIYFKIEGKSLTAEFIDKTGKVEFAKTITKP